MGPRKHPAKDARITARTMLTDEYQARLAALSRALCGEPVRSMWLSGGPRDGWHLSGQKGGDFALPGTKGCTTWQEALVAAERWAFGNPRREVVKQIEAFCGSESQPEATPTIMDSTPRKNPPKVEFLWFQCTQCGWGEEDWAGDWTDGAACPHCGIGPIRSSRMECEK